MSGLPKVPQLVSGRPGTGSLVPVTPKPVLPTPHTRREEAHSANLTILVRLPLFSPEITLREQRKTGLQGCGSEFSPIIKWLPPAPYRSLCTHVELKRTGSHSMPWPV